MLANLAICSLITITLISQVLEYYSNIQMQQQLTINTKKLAQLIKFAQARAITSGSIVIVNPQKNIITLQQHQQNILQLELPIYTQLQFAAFTKKKFLQIMPNGHSPQKGHFTLMALQANNTKLCSNLTFNQELRLRLSTKTC